MKNLKLSTKIILGFASLVLVTTVVGSVSAWYSMQLKKQTQKIAKEYLPADQMTEQITQESLASISSCRNYT